MLAILAAKQQSWNTYLIVLGIVLIVVLIMWALGKLAPSKSFSAGGNALMHAQVFFNPSCERVIEAKQREDKEDEESGDPPESGLSQN